MRVQRFVFNEHDNGYDSVYSYGFPIPTADMVPVATPSPFREYVEYTNLAGFGGEWEDWCDVNFYTPENNAKCKECNKISIPLLGERCTWPDPKTMAGKAARGLPQQTDLQRLGPAGSDQVVTIPENGSGTPGTSWFEQNKMLVIAGGAAAALALVFMMSRKGRRMNGIAGLFGFGSKRVRRRKARRN